MGQSLKAEIESGSFSVTKYLEDLINTEPSSLENLDKYDLSEFDCEIPSFVRKQASFWR